MRSTGKGIPLYSFDYRNRKSPTNSIPVFGPRRHEVASPFHGVIEVLKAIVTTLGDGELHVTAELHDQVCLRLQGVVLESGRAEHPRE